MAKHNLDSNYLDPDYEPVVNHSGNRVFQDVLAARMQRRTLMKGGVGAALASIMGVGLANGGDHQYVRFSITPTPENKPQNRAANLPENRKPGGLIRKAHRICDFFV